MKRRNFAVTALALVAMAFATTSACKKESGGGASGASGDMLSYLPKDNKAVVGISWAKARGSALFKKYEKDLMADAPADLATLKEKCGIDIMADLNTIVVALKDYKSEDDAILALKGNFDQSKVEECYSKMGGKAEGGVYEADGERLNAYWPAKDTVIVSKNMSADDMKKAVSGGSLKDNKELMALVKKVNSSATLWGAGQVPPEAGAMMGGMGGKPPSGAYFSVKVDSGVDGKLGLSFESEDDASSMSTMITMGLSMGKGQPGMKELLGGISSERDGKTIVIKAKLSGEQLTKLQQMGGAAPF